MTNVLDPVRNIAVCQANTGYDASVTSVVLASGHGAKLPVVASEGAFNLVWWNWTDYPNPKDDPNVEIVRVTARSTDTLTITRAQEGTSAATHNTANKTYYLMLAPTKKLRDDIEAFLQTLGTGAFATIANYAPLAGATFTGDITITHPGGVPVLDLKCDHATLSYGLIGFRCASGNRKWYIATDQFYSTGLEFIRDATTMAMYLSSAAGTAALPTLTLEGDIDTGLYSIGADSLGISTNGVLRLAIDATGLTTAYAVLSSSPTAGIGYSAGAGGAQTQGTNKATTVTLNTICGTITTHNASLAAGAIVSFQVTDSAVAATDVIHLQHDSGGTLGAYTLNASGSAAGHFHIDIRNNTAGALTDAIVIRFVVIKAVVA
jgi:hypothetical protein